MVLRWKTLGEHLLTRFNDGYVAGEGEDPERGYPEAWLREVVARHPEQFRLVQPEEAETDLPYCRAGGKASVVPLWLTGNRRYNRPDH